MKTRQNKAKNMQAVINTLTTQIWNYNFNETYHSNI